MPVDSTSNYNYSKPTQSEPAAQRTKPTSINHADYLSRNSAPVTPNANDQTPTDRLINTPSTADVLAQRNPAGNPADHSYTISTRSFAPPESFGGGFAGDDRGYSTNLNDTSRIHSTVTIDADDQVAIGAADVNAHSDPSIHHAIPFYTPTETPTVDVLSQGVEHNGDVSTLNFETRHSGEDAVLEIPFINRNPSPSLDVNTDLQVVSDREANTLTITGEITGDNFPATEVFINDNNGQAVFLATGKPPAVATPAVNLIDGGIWDRHIADVSTTINTDESGNFLSVESDGKTYSIAEWNNQFEARDPGFTDPFEGFNDAFSELHEGYTEIGSEFSEAATEIGNAGNVFSGTYEVAEAGVEIAAEVVEATASTVGGLATGTAEATVGIADAIIPGDGIPFVDLNIEAPGWWPGK